MNVIVRIPEEHTARVSSVDPERLEQAALEAILRTADADRFAVVGIESKLTPQEAAARMRAARPGNKLPPGVTIRDLMTYGRA